MSRPARKTVLTVRLALSEGLAAGVTEVTLHHEPIRRQPAPEGFEGWFRQKTTRSNRCLGALSKDPLKIRSVGDRSLSRLARTLES